jgi:hypothetical protein
MSVSATQIPWPAVNARPQPERPIDPVADRKAEAVLQPLPDNPAQHIQPQRRGRDPKVQVQGDPPKPVMPDLHFPDPLPGLPKIDTPAPKSGYSAALGILGRSAKGELG